MEVHDDTATNAPRKPRAARKPRQVKPTSQLVPFKRWCEEKGLSYSSGRDAHFRGELPMVKIGSNEKHQAWYVDRAAGERWIASRTERHSGAA